MVIPLVVFLSKMTVFSQKSLVRSSMMLLLGCRGVSFIFYSDTLYLYRLTGVTPWPFLVIDIKHYFNNLYMIHLS